ncbi:MAG: cation:proton antiporter subunit C [Sphaerochaetaceae bacterium]|nr:cation:proton antiporter subunit C [Sphaerochaetaceae bacterium]
MIRYILLGILFIIGMYALIFHRSVIKKVIALGIVNTSVVLLFIISGSSIGDAPAFTGEQGARMVDPMVQALMLTAIVIGVCITSFSLALIVHLWGRFETFDIDTIEKRGDDES